MYRLCESPSTTLTTKSNKVLSGLFAECEVLNQNERIYPKRIYMPALEAIMPKIRSGRLLGECDHPTDRDEVFLSNVSHVVKECKVEGNKVYGTVELLDTPAGKIAQALVEAGIPLGISSRGVGNTRRVNEGDEVTDFKLITFDLVADPSFSNAVLSESAKSVLTSRLDDVACSLPLNESACDNTTIRSRIQEIKKSLDKAPTVTSKLVESIGELTEDKLTLQESLSEVKSRNKSLSDNMSRLQETYNTLYESTKIMESKYAKDIKNYKLKLKSIKESYELKQEESNSEIIKLRKELAIEKRGLSVDQMMPILEGLESPTDIENKLDSVKNLGARRYTSTRDNDGIGLTEGLHRKKSRLSSIVSSV